MPGTKATEAERREQLLNAAYEVASRKGLDGLTVRAVAGKAGLSPGLVLYHFKRKDQLVRALLDWLLRSTSLLQVPETISEIDDPVERLHTLLRQEMDRASSDTGRSQLLFEYWALGTRHAAIRRRIEVEMNRYRLAFREVAEDVLRSEMGRFLGVTPDGLAAVAVSLVHGCAVQAMIDPKHFDIAEYLDAAEGLVGQIPLPTR
ncbi:MAG TPA: TetR/AcrR family transcriptional regulator [Gemmatimonadaceae bacterium]|nr:TetR/AcrR family transcriptional regulator [Gemmatimonadaceae bacterium]